MKYLVLFLIYFIPLYPRIEVFRIAGVATAIRCEDFMVAAIYYMWVLFLLMSGRSSRRIFPNNRITLGILIFVVAASVSTIVGIQKGTINAGVGLIFLLRYVEYFLIYFVVYSWASEKYCGDYLKTISLVLLVVIGIAYLDGFDLTPAAFSRLYGSLDYLGWDKGHVHATFSHNYDLGAYLFMNATLLLAALFIRRTHDNRHSMIQQGDIERQNNKCMEYKAPLLCRRKWEPLFARGWINIWGASQLSHIVFCITLSLLIYLMILVYSRSSLMAVFTSTVILGLISKPLIKQWLAVMAVFIAVIIIVGNIFAIDMRLADIVLTTTGIGSRAGISDVSFLWRLRLWDMVMKLFSKNILLGGGLSSVARVFAETGEKSLLATATECWYVRVLGEMGIVGLCAFFLFKYFILIELYQRYKQSRNVLLRQYFGGLFAVTLGLLVSALFVDIYTAFKVISFYMLLLGLAARFSELEKGDRGGDFGQSHIGQAVRAEEDSLSSDSRTQL